MANGPKVVITADTDQAEAALIRLKGGVQGAAKELISISGIVGAFSIGAMGAFIKGAIDAADELNNLSVKSGSSVEALAGLKYAAEQNDTSLNSVADAAKKLSTNLASSPDLLRRYGVTATDTTGALVQLADVFERMPNGVNKSNLAVSLFGKSGADMIPMLNQGSDALSRQIALGQQYNPITTESAASAAEFKDQLDQLSSQAGGFAISLSNVVLPNLTKTATAMNDLAREGHPVLALWRGLAGMGQIPWDLLIPPANIKKELSSEGMIKDLDIEIGSLERKKASGNGKLMQWMFGTPKEIDAEIAMLQDRIKTIRLHAPEIDKPTATGKPSKSGSVDTSASEHQAQIDAAVAREQAKYDRMHELAISFGASETERVSWKLAFDLESMEKEHQANITKYGRNTELDIAYEAARLERMQTAEAEAAAISAKTAKREEDERQKKIRSDMSIANFSELLRQKDYSGAMGMAEKLSAGMATKSRAMFEINKVSALASATINGYDAVVKAYNHGSLWGGPFGGAAEAAIAAAYVATQLDAINSTSFGGGGGGAASSGGGIPSQATSPGIPVSQQPVQEQQSQPVNIQITVQALDPNAITDETRRRIADSLAPAIQQNFARNGQNVAVMV